MGTRDEPAWRATLRAALARRFGIDPRALAAYRIAIAALVLVDQIVYRAPDLGAFYTDSGVLPAAVLAESFPVAADLTLHTLAGSLAGQLAPLALTLTAAAALLVGYRTRLAALATWLLLASMQARNPHVLNAGDTLVVATLFFGLFLPLGARWSIDAARGSGRTATADEGLVVNAASLGLMLQVVIVYATNLAFKTRSERWMEGTAVAHVFALDDFTVRLGDLLAQLDGLLVAANWTWLAALAVSPLLLVLTGWARAGLVVLLASLHLGMLATLMLGPFPLVSIALLLVFLPAEAFDRLEVRLRAPARRLGARFHRPGASHRWQLPGRWRSRARTCGNALLAVAIVLGLAWHGMALGWLDEPEAVEELGRAGEHRWSMFSPPSTSYGWVAAPANLTTNETVDAIQLAPYSPQPPGDVAEAYPSTLWHRYLKDADELRVEEHAALAEHLCGRAAEAYDASVERIELVHVEHEIRLDGDDPVERTKLHEQACP